ncbi:NAD(P)/FAD-dependent oxidoreductase [Niabella beijingensis]|uniref:NAD(P)/FAD-dependent oxidoreductase n=1 Tax=Niabella beijingensis TaxID=2872700 RepID=UPI001CC0DAAA|nr:FAD-dependent oxidoreductase [Niabella beijingensis]MBZ4187842.1 FAD-binding oxidoreductase [Niabella beijingensis]
MRLRTFESFWLVKNGLLHSYPSLQEDLQSEIIVIGGGITGALISHALLKEGYEVTLLDKRDIGQGSTAATTSMLQYEIDVPLYQLADLIGEAAAVRCYKAGIRAIDELSRLVALEKLDCGFKEKQSLYFAHDDKAAEWLRREYEIRDRHQLGVEWLPAAGVAAQYQLQTSGGIRSAKAASMDAYKFTHELLQRNRQKGLQVYDQTEIAAIDYHKDGVALQLANGHKAHCKKIVFCSGYETVSFFPEKTARLFSTFACVSETGIRIPQELREVLIWNTEKPYIYMRTTDDGRLLIGGADSPFNSGSFRERVKEKKTAALLKKLGNFLPGVRFIDDFSWAGCFGATRDGLPFIGKHDKYPNALFVLGFGGNGITFSIQGMELILKLLRGEQDPLLELYRFGR